MTPSRRLISCSIVQTIHRTKRYSVQIACDVLGALIRDRLIPVFAAGVNVKEADQVRLERACVTFVLLTVSATDDTVHSAIESLQVLLDNLMRDARSLLTTKAVHAMQTLMWKTCGSNAANADAWLQLLRHPALDGAGQANKARIGR